VGKNNRFILGVEARTLALRGIIVTVLLLYGLCIDQFAFNSSEGIKI
jgi:hypothetical protein